MREHFLCPVCKEGQFRRRIWENIGDECVVGPCRYCGVVCCFTCGYEYEDSGKLDEAGRLALIDDGRLAGTIMDYHKSGDVSTISSGGFIYFAHTSGSKLGITGLNRGAPVTFAIDREIALDVKRSRIYRAHK